MGVPEVLVWPVGAWVCVCGKGSCACIRDSLIRAASKASSHAYKPCKIPCVRNIPRNIYHARYPACTMQHMLHGTRRATYVAWYTQGNICCMVHAGQHMLHGTRRVSCMVYVAWYMLHGMLHSLLHSMVCCTMRMQHAYHAYTIQDACDGLSACLRQLRPRTHTGTGV
jgi:hypothetical protein